MKRTCNGACGRGRLCLFVVLLVLSGGLRTVVSEEPVLGFLSSALRTGPASAETRAALELAQRLGPVEHVISDGEGHFFTGAGDATALERFRVVWLHEGDSARSLTRLARPALIDALRRHVADGGGLLLSGLALSMAHDLGVEPARPRISKGGTDTYQAGIVPVVSDHPIFRTLRGSGIALDERVGGNPRDIRVPITSSGFPAFSDFHGSGGPRGGMLLARATASNENPLVEYALGRGRIVVLGWRLPHYADSANAYRENLERLTKNILDYLGSPEVWRPLTSVAKKEASTPSPGVPAEAWRAAERAIRDLTRTFGARYPAGPSYLERLDRLRAEHDKLLDRRKRVIDSASEGPGAIVRGFEALRREALLANPLLSSDKLLLIERGARRLGLPANFHGNSDIPQTGYENRIAVLSPVHPDGELRTVFRPEGGRFVGDLELHFDAEKLLFSMPGANGRWQVHEIRIDGTGLREIPLIEEPDVDNCDAAYLPDERIIFTSTATFAGVPCVDGASPVTNVYLRGTGGSIRQLTVDQDHDWCPVVANDGTVLYLRWEYTDLPHSNSRILFRMNPDGTHQAAVWGSNSFFPNSFFYARPVPGHPTKVVGIATGHHGVARAGRLLVADTARDEGEASGIVAEVPGWGKRVRAVIRDNLVDDVWPRFLHPWPLSEKYFLVSAKLGPSGLWGIYLADVFDNILLLHQVKGHALLEPIPVEARDRPPVIPDRVDPARRDAIVYLHDVYKGEGLEGVPRGTVKELRLFTYHYSYRGMGGLLGAVGLDGPWDVKRVLGKVPVEKDGSAFFRVPANTPISVQPLDAHGRALQLMRSWFTAMPGEALSCVGCHERQKTSPSVKGSIASRRPPSAIAPWYGEVRGFSFAREVQPVLDRHCVRCHDGQETRDGKAPCDLRGDEIITDWSSDISGHAPRGKGGRFSRAYVELHRFVRRPGIESDIRLLSPMEFHASTTELVQLLEKGHGDGDLVAEDWDRLITWIDLNAPYHGTWSEIAGPAKVRAVAERRRAMSARYAGVDVDPEAIPPLSAVEDDVRSDPAVEVSSPSARDGDDKAEPESGGDPSPARSVKSDHRQAVTTIELGRGVAMKLVRVPAGEFVMGDAEGSRDERPRTVVHIERAFWMGRHEITNEEYALFDPDHRSRVEPMHGYQFGIRGYPVDGPHQPVVRVSWSEATRFCKWLTRRSGRVVRLPTEAEWEYACRAGTSQPFWYGDLDTNFSRVANMADKRISEFALDTYIRVRLVERPNRYDDWVPKDARFDDGGFVSKDAGSYQPSWWQLCDMHGNVAEWTASLYRPYPYVKEDGRNDPRVSGRRVVRGGSWYDRPARCRSAFRLAYPPYQRVFNVGFRVVVEEPAAVVAGAEH